MPVGGGGLLGGWGYAVLNAGPVQRWAVATSASCIICATSFAGEIMVLFQEAKPIIAVCPVALTVSHVLIWPCLVASSTGGGEEGEM